MRRVRNLDRAAGALTLVLLACSSKHAASPDLAAYLYDLAGKPEATRAAEVATWTLDREAWNHVVVEAYRPLYDEYVAELDAARPTFVALLATKRAMQSRAHFAGDPKMTWSEAITRWALPTLAKARIAEVAGQPPTPFDAVFVDVDGRWRAIAGVGPIVRRHVAALDANCAQLLDRIEVGGGPCIEAAWAVADAALRVQRERFAHACGIAANVCGKRSP